jgi:hypothetical protein
VSIIRTKTKRLFWTASDSPDLAGYVVYAIAGDMPHDQALALIAAGNQTPIGTPTNPEFFLTPNTLPDGSWDFYVAALDKGGNESDPLHADQWEDVTTDTQAPNPPTGGGIEEVEG